MTTTVLITGAGSGFGKGAAAELARRGHPVIAAVRDLTEAQALSAEHPDLRVEVLDVTNPGHLAQIDGWHVDVLIANAGLGQGGPLRLVPLDLIRRVFEVNVFGTVATVQAAARQMVARGSGRILIVSSVAGVLAGPGTGPYSMTKHALQAFGTALRAELAPLGVDVALINPGPFGTGFNDRMAASVGPWFDEGASDADRAVMDAVRQRITVGQLDPADVVQVYADLAEAPSTQLVNFIPPDIVERITRSH